MNSILNDISIDESGFKEFKQINITWFLTNYCNFECEYCMEKEYITNDKKLKDDEFIALNLFKLKNLEHNFNIDLTGGEPTYHDEFYNIINSLINMNNCKQITIITNFSKSISFWENIKKSPKINIGASYHPKYSKDYINKILQISKRFKINPLINITNNKKEIEESKNIINTLIEHNISICYNPIISTATYKVEDNILENIDFLKIEDRIEIKDENHSNLIPFKQKDIISNIYIKDIIQNKLNYFKGYYCNILSFNIIKGLILNSCTNKRIHNINDEIKKYYKCPHNICNCSMKFKYHKINKDIYENI